MIAVRHVGLEPGGRQRFRLSDFQMRHACRIRQRASWIHHRESRKEHESERESPFLEPDKTPGAVGRKYDWSR